jgi:predicted Fe-S protein YdhL (DUF1289 family)
MDSAAQSITVESPCIRQCILYQRRFCLGCYRLACEIKEWSTISETHKLAIIEKCAERKTWHEQVHGGES